MVCRRVLLRPDRAFRAVSAGLLCFACASCTGYTFGRRAAGQSTFLQYGGLAVDHRTDVTFIAARSLSGEQKLEQDLYAIAPDAGSPRRLASLTDRTDTRILFPEGGIVLMTESGDTEELVRLDQHTLQTIATSRHESRYHGTRLSPSRRWIAVAENQAQQPNSLFLIDSQTLFRTPIPYEGSWLEAGFFHGEDRLAAAVFTSIEADVEPEPSPITPTEPASEPRSSELYSDLPKTAPALHLKSFTVEQIVGDKEPPSDESAPLDIVIPGKEADRCVSSTWLTISPNDRFVVVPVLDAQTRRNELILVDTTDQTVREIPRGKGPVGFTPDSRFPRYLSIPDRRRSDRCLRVSVGKAVGLQTRRRTPQANPCFGRGHAARLGLRSAAHRLGVLGTLQLLRERPERGGRPHLGSLRRRKPTPALPV